MRKIVCLIAFLGAVFRAECQTATLKLSPKALTGAQNAIIKIIGRPLFEKHFVLDTLDSWITNRISYTGDVIKSVTLGRDTVFTVVYFVIQNRDTIGYVDIEVNENGNPLNDWREPTSSGKPEVLIGYKRLLTNKLPITYKKAIEIGRKKGFIEPPHIDAQTVYKSSIVGKESFIQVKILWTFYNTSASQNGVMSINADTGEIDREQYYHK